MWRKPETSASKSQNPDAKTSNVVVARGRGARHGDNVVALTSSLSRGHRQGHHRRRTHLRRDWIPPATTWTSNVAALGLLTTSRTTLHSRREIPFRSCGPPSGTAAADICLFSQAGFDTSMSYTVSGPGDVAVIAKQPAGLGIIHLTLQIPSQRGAGRANSFHSERQSGPAPPPPGSWNAMIRMSFGRPR